MDPADEILHGRARAIADRYATAGTEVMAEAEIVYLVREYVRKALERESSRPHRPNCF